VRRFEMSAQEKLQGLGRCPECDSPIKVKIGEVGVIGSSIAKGSYYAELECPECDWESDFGIVADNIASEVCALARELLEEV
jgi:ssDNA-binding Zn-finger/Zn-ribbon topoisomerase 1